jgi:hypothetical protein
MPLQLMALTALLALMALLFRLGHNTGYRSLRDLNPACLGTANRYPVGRERLFIDPGAFGMAILEPKLLYWPIRQIFYL